MSRDKSGLFLQYWQMLARDEVQPEPEYKFAASIGRKWRFDWAFPAERVAVEIEGNAWNVAGGGRHMQDSDLDKYNHAASLRWLVFRFSPGMLRRDPAGCIEIVRQAVQDGR